MRAALALGYFDYTKAHYAQAAKWFDRAKGDPLLRDYLLYWTAENDLAQGHSADAVTELKQFRQDFPDSVITDQALQTLGEAALASNQPAEAVTALNAYSATPDRPALLFLRAEAHEQAGEKDLAAADYQAVYLRFAVSEQAREATMKLSFLASTPGTQIPPIPLDQRNAHAGDIVQRKRLGQRAQRVCAAFAGADRRRSRTRAASHSRVRRFARRRPCRKWPHFR